MLMSLQIVKTNQIKNITENSFQLIDLDNFKFIINSGMLSQILILEMEMMSLTTSQIC